MKGYEVCGYVYAQSSLASINDETGMIVVFLLFWKEFYDYLFNEHLHQYLVPRVLRILLDCSSAAAYSSELNVLTALSDVRHKTQATIPHPAWAALVTIPSSISDPKEERPHETID